MTNNELWGLDSGFVQEVPKENKPSFTPGLPRALHPGEFYCHRCREFALLAKHAEHNLQCKQIRIKKGI